LATLKNPPSREYQAYQQLEHWKPYNEILLKKEFSKSKAFSTPLFNFLYEKVKKEYQHVPRRKNDKDAFTHPLNVAMDLIKAKVDDEITICAGLIHDLIEEKVDIFKKKKQLKEDSESASILDQYELKICTELETQLQQFALKNKIPLPKITELIQVVKLLTRHKRHFYYRSISSIFNCQNPKLKERAIQVKLADRIHNIQSIECFKEEELVYQCFKNLFILNNTKKFLQDKYGKKNNPSKGIHPTEKLFKKCCKSTYDAFLTVGGMCLNKNISPVVSMLQLAFHKYAWEKKGSEAVTDVNISENHPMRLFHGIVKKYDAKLHQEKDKFNFMKEQEREYCRRFFRDYHFSEEQISAIVDYKDAFALREITARLLYDPEYVVSNFSCSKLCTRGMVCMKDR